LFHNKKNLGEMDGEIKFNAEIPDYYLNSNVALNPKKHKS
jgi:hypothetical protein